MGRLLAITSLLIVIPGCLFATEFESGTQRVDVIELFTSEGCSSCPPADRWFRELSSHPDLFSEFVPLAFHVDYWDYIGWEDRFARAEFSQRQRNYVREGRVSQPYTPGFVLNSREWRGWFRGSRSWDSSNHTAGNLKASVENGKVQAEFSGAGAGQLHVALLGMGLFSEVKAGENRGRQLSHDFVVLAHITGEGARQWSLELPDIPAEGQTRTALAIWVTPANSQAIIQATGGYLN